MPLKRREVARDGDGAGAVVWFAARTGNNPTIACAALRRSWGTRSWGVRRFVGGDGDQRPLQASSSAIFFAAASSWVILKVRIWPGVRAPVAGLADFGAGLVWVSAVFHLAERSEPREREVDGAGGGGWGGGSLRWRVGSGGMEAEAIRCLRRARRGRCLLTRSMSMMRPVTGSPAAWSSDELVEAGGDEPA